MADAWCFSTAEYVVLTNAGALVGFGCDAHLAAILATVQVPAHAMLYRDWLGTPWNPPVPRTGPEAPPAAEGG